MLPVCFLLISNLLCGQLGFNLLRLCRTHQALFWCLAAAAAATWDAQNHEGKIEVPAKSNCDTRSHIISLFFCGGGRGTPACLKRSSSSTFCFWRGPEGLGAGIYSWSHPSGIWVGNPWHSQIGSLYYRWSYWRLWRATLWYNHIFCWEAIVSLQILWLLLCYYMPHHFEVKVVFFSRKTRRLVSSSSRNLWEPCCQMSSPFGIGSLPAWLLLVYSERRCDKVSLVSLLLGKEL